MCPSNGIYKPARLDQQDHRHSHSFNTALYTTGIGYTAAISL